MKPMKPVINAWIGGALLALCCGRLNAADLTIVADGKPNAVIVVAAGETNAIRVATEIQKYIEKMSGTKLPVVNEPEADTTGLPVKIAVGHTQLAAKNGVAIPSGFKEVVGDPRAFEEEGFVIKTKGNAVILGGNSDGHYLGTLYAGYEFLERLGCRWYFPGEWGEVIPERKTVVFPETDLVSKPDFVIRGISGPGSGWSPATAEEDKAYKEWFRKAKYSYNPQSCANFYPGVGDGFLAYLVPPREFQTNDPTLYAMNKSGSRTQPLYENQAMLSLCNPKTFELAVKNLKEAFAGKRKTSIVSSNGFGISPPDGSCYDFDPEAVKKNQNFRYPAYDALPMTSEEYFDFAVRLAKEFPDKWVSTMAYCGREMPPQGVKIPPNMAVLYAPIATDVLHPCGDPRSWRRMETLSIMRQWCKLSPHVFMYDYNPGFLLGSFVPERDVANFAVNVKLYKAMKLKGFETEGRKTYMVNWISYYMRGKLMWDANADVAALKQDFYTTFFGSEAGPFVQQWWDECEKALAATTMECHEDWLVTHVYTVAFTQNIHQYVVKAAQCEMTPKQKEHFNAFALIADHLEAIAARDEAEKNLDYAEAIKQAQRAEDDNAKLVAIYSFFSTLKYGGDFTGAMGRYKKFVQMTNGTTGTLVATIPLETKFKRDPYNEGVVMEWYLPAYDDKDWRNENTFYTWDQQDPPEDAKGHSYNGYGWYRVIVNIPADAVNKPLKLHLGGVINEGWVWVNGQYVGHREWKLWWSGRERLEMDVDATGKVQAGPNVITIRIWNDADSGGGLLRRGFLWLSKSEAVLNSKSENGK